MTGKAAQTPLKSLQYISVELDSGAEWWERKTNTLVDKASPAATELQQNTGRGACPGFCKQCVSSVTVTHISNEQGRRSQRAWSVEIFPAARACLRGFRLAHSSEESISRETVLFFTQAEGTQVNSLSAKERNAAETLFEDIWSWEAEGHKPLTGRPSTTAGGIKSVMPDIHTSSVSISLPLSQLQHWAQHNPPFPTVLVSGSMEELLVQGVSRSWGIQPPTANRTGWWEPIILYSHTDSQHRCPRSANCTKAIALPSLRELQTRTGYLRER